MCKVRGTCIWFSEKKGYGFLKSDNGEEAFVHYKTIKEPGFKCLYRGQRVTYELEDTQRGLLAKNVKYDKDFQHLQ